MGECDGSLLKGWDLDCSWRLKPCFRGGDSDGDRSRAVVDKTRGEVGRADGRHGCIAWRCRRGAMRVELWWGMRVMRRRLHREDGEMGRWGDGGEAREQRTEMGRGAYWERGQAEKCSCCYVVYA